MTISSWLVGGFDTVKLDQALVRIMKAQVNENSRNLLDARMVSGYTRG